MVEVNLNCESENIPNQYAIENIINGKCDIILNDNIKELTSEDGKTYYIYDSYRIVKNNYRDTLAKDLSNQKQFLIWINFAKEQYSKQIIKISDSDRISALEQAIIDIGEVIGND